MVLRPCGFVEDELSQDLAVCLGLPFISTLNDCCALDPAERTEREGLWWCCWDQQQDPREHHKEQHSK